jgi:hypothetical protein
LAPFLPNTWHKLELMISGKPPVTSSNRVLLKAWDGLAITANFDDPSTGTSFTSGQVGIGTLGTKMAFDDLRVTQIPVGGGLPASASRTIALLLIVLEFLLTSALGGTGDKALTQSGVRVFVVGLDNAIVGFAAAPSRRPFRFLFSASPCARLAERRRPTLAGVTANDAGRHAPSRIILRSHPDWQTPLGKPYAAVFLLAFAKSSNALCASASARA